MSSERISKIGASPQEYSNFPAFREMHERAEKILTDSAIDPNDFKHPNGDYDAKTVDEDLAYVETRKAGFDNETKPFSELLEAILFEHIELSNWFGPNAITRKTSAYDDIANGVDLVTEFTPRERPKNHLALAVDVTFGSRILSKKFYRVKEEIRNDELATIKYFNSDTIHGRLKQVPRVAVGLEKEMVIELANLWYAKKYKDLEQHPAQHLILSQIYNQLRIFKLYAKKQGKINAEKAYASALLQIREVMNLKKPERPAELPEDRVYEAIRDQLREMQDEMQKLK